MPTIEAKVICDSIGKHSPRLLTIRATNPKFIHQETLRHRTIYIEDALRGDYDFSFSVSSARAIPFPKLLEEAMNPSTNAKPVKWGAEQKGMSPGDEVTDIESAIRIWNSAAADAGMHAARLAEVGVHKSICNRIIEPYIHVHCLMTATEPGWMNFFGLRLDEAADPTVRALAEQCYIVWCDSTPTKLEPGQWHLPFIDDLTIETVVDMMTDHMRYNVPGAATETSGDISRKVSVARCARLSYTSFETGRRSTIEEDLALYDRLITSRPIHASPAEHQATPDKKSWLEIPGSNTSIAEWEHLDQAGNLGPGWIQYRKTLPGEAVAKLPEGYIYGTNT